MVAGNRDAEISLAGLISAGTVYRFIHKPMSPGRARLFADAAVKKYEEQRRLAAAAPVAKAQSRSNRGLLVGGTIGALGVIIVATWAMRRGSSDDTAAPQAAAADAVHPAAAESPLRERAAAALAANRLTEPAGDNALELYLQAQARNPADALARAGLAEVRERLLARAENALLEERLDEASAAIETARKSGVERGRIAFLMAQLAKSRERIKAVQAATRARGETPAGEDKTTALLNLAAQRLNDAHLIDPERDSALYYVQEALRLDPNSNAAQEAEKALAMRLLAETHSAIDRRDFAHASGWLEAAKGVAAPANIEAAESSLAAARREADTDAWTALLKNAAERVQQDRLIEPENDSAKYYLLTLRGLDPGNAGLAAATRELGIRLAAKARRALELEQYDAARSWLDEARAIGFSSAETESAQHDLDAAAAGRQFLANVVPAGDLTLVKSVKPDYPRKASSSKIEGWVELDFTVAESGKVTDIAVHAVSTPGVFEATAIGALSQWRYKPVLRDAKPVAQRARIRIRFALAN
jgi:protein TonB